MRKKISQLKQTGENKLTNNIKNPAFNKKQYKYSWRKQFFFENRKRNLRISPNHSNDNSNTYTKDHLLKMTIEMLKNLALKYKIDLLKARRKSDIVDLILFFFTKKNDDISVEILPKTFPMETDFFGLINVSLWFKHKRKKMNRSLGSKRFRDLLMYHATVKKKKLSELMVKKDDCIFMAPVLALHIATFLDTVLYHEILDFYLSYKHLMMEKIFINKLKLMENKLLFARVGFKYVNNLRWVLFNASCAYYHFIIDKVVKAGSVGGLKPLSKNQSLDMRLATHRSTYARFRLLGIIVFEESLSVRTFEHWMKQVLFKYSIGQSGMLEQYECTKGATDIIVSNTIDEQFNSITSSIGQVVPQELINEYNETMLVKTLSSRLDPNKPLN